MYDLLLNICFLSEIFPLVFLYRFDYYRYNEIFILMFDFTLSKFLVTLIAILIMYLNFWDVSLNSFFQNIYTVLYFVIISRLYKTILIDIDSIIFKVGNITFLLGLIMNGIWFDFRYEFFNYATSMVNLIFSIYGIIFFIVSERGINSVRFSNYFWLNIALVTYNMCLFPAMLFDHFIIGKSWSFISELLWSIVLIASILLNIVLSISFLQVINVREEVVAKK